MANRFAMLLVAALPAVASTAAAAPLSRRVQSNPFDFSVEKEAPPKKGFLKRILDHVDGGDFHGFGNADGTSRKAENFLRTTTVQAKFHF